MKSIRRTTLAFLIAASIAGPANAEIRIAVAGPLTGSLALLGAQLRAGAEAAVRVVNDNGGLLGEELVLEAADDACSEERAGAVANQLAGAGVVFVVGHLCSAPSIAASEVYAAERIVQIAPGAPDPRFTEERPGSGIFRLYGREDRQGRVAAEFLLALDAQANIAIVDDRSAYGRRLTDTVIKELEDQGREIDRVDSYSVGGSDFDGLIDRLIEDDIEAVFVGGFAEEVASLRLRMVQLDYGPLLLGGDALADQTYFELAGIAAEGTLFTYQSDPTKRPESLAATMAISAAGDSSDGFALYAFAAIEIWAAAVDRAGTTAFADVAAEITAGAFQTALGTVGFSEFGDADLPDWVVYQWHGSTFEYYLPQTAD